MDQNFTQITPDNLVFDILEQWPVTASVFLNHRMACVGCDMSSFETLSNAAEIYQISLSQLIQELEEMITAAGCN